MDAPAHARISGRRSLEAPTTIADTARPLNTTQLITTQTAVAPDVLVDMRIILTASNRAQMK